MAEDNSNASNTSEKSKPLSYDPMKAIIKFSSMDKREIMARRIPALRKVDNLMPYHFKEVSIGAGQFPYSFSFESGSSSGDWDFKEDDPKRRSLVYVSTPSCIRGHAVKKTVHVAFAKLVKEYLKAGSTVDQLNVEFMNPEDLELENWKLKVNNLHFQWLSQKLIPLWLKALDDTHTLKSIKFIADSHNTFMFENPMVKSCEKLIIQWPDDTYELNDRFFDLQNLKLEITHPYFTAERTEKLLRNWVNYGRPLGTSFTRGVHQFTEVIDLFDLAANWFPQSVPSVFPNITHGARHCVTIPMNEQLELVIFGEADLEKYANWFWKMRFEVMKKGATVPK